MEELKEVSVSEAECLVCRFWPAAERPQRRYEYFFKDGLVLIPRDHICSACKAVAEEMVTRKKH